MRKFLLLAAALASPLVAQNAPVLFDQSRMVPLSPGQWSYSATPGGSEARFGSAFAIRCDRSARRVTLTRGGPVSISAGAMTVATDLAINALPANGVLASNDRVLDAIAFSRGRFIISGGGVQLVLPASPEAARSIEDCRI